MNKQTITYQLKGHKVYTTKAFSNVGEMIERLN